MYKRGFFFQCITWCTLLLVLNYTFLTTSWASNPIRVAHVPSSDERAGVQGEREVLLLGEVDAAGMGFHLQNVEQAREILNRLRQTIQRMGEMQQSNVSYTPVPDDAPPLPVFSPVIEEMNRCYEEFRWLLLEARQNRGAEWAKLLQARDQLFSALDEYLNLLQQQSDYLDYYDVPQIIRERNQLMHIAAQEQVEAFRTQAIRVEKALQKADTVSLQEADDLFEWFENQRAVPRDTIVERNHRIMDKKDALVLADEEEPSDVSRKSVFSLASLGTPTIADTTANIEVRITDEIRALAASLDHSPIRILDWVRDHIEFVPYYGSLKGAELTLIDRAGNDMDTSSLLIALLRAAGIPARYVVGTATLNYETYRNLLGMESLDAVNAVIGTLAKPGGAILLDSANNPTRVRIGHVWVAAYLPSNYRGTGGGSGNLWLQMDPTFSKRITRTPAATVTEFTQLDPGVIGNSLMGAGVYDATKNQLISYDSSVTAGMAQDLAQDVDRFYEERNVADNFFQQNALLRGASLITPWNYAVLPVSLPFEVSQVSGVYAELPSNVRFRVEFNFRKPSGLFNFYDPDFSLDEQVKRTYATAELAAKRVTVSFIPRSGNDAMAMYSIGQPTPVMTLPSGATTELSRLALIPANVVRVLPMLRIDGQHQMLGPIQGYGEENDLVITLTGPEGTYSEKGDYKIQAGGYHAIAFDFGGVQAEWSNRLIVQLLERLDKFEQTLAIQMQGTELTPDQEIPLDDLVGAALHIAAINYFVELNYKQQQWANSIGVLRVRNPSVGIVSQEMAVQETADFIGRITRSIIGNKSSLGLDVRVASQTLISRNRVKRDLNTNPLEGGSPLAAGQVMNTAGVTREEFLVGMAGGITSSQTEHRVMERQFGHESFSAMKMMADSMERGEPMTMLSRAQLCTEAGRQLTNSEISAAVRTKLADFFRAFPDVQSGIINQVNNGQVVFVPASGVVASATDNPGFVQYRGTGYIYMDPGNAAGGYIISSDAAGSASLCGSETADVAELVTCVKSQLGSIAPACCCAGMQDLNSSSSTVQQAAAIDACAGCGGNIASAFIKLDPSGLAGDMITCAMAAIVGPALAAMTAQMDDLLQMYPNQGQGVEPSKELKRMADTISLTLIVLFGLFSNATGQLLSTLGISLPLMPGAGAIIGAYMALMLAHFFVLDLILENPNF